MKQPVQDSGEDDESESERMVKKAGAYVLYTCTPEVGARSWLRPFSAARGFPSISLSLVIMVLLLAVGRIVGRGVNAEGITLCGLENDHIILLIDMHHLPDGDILPIVELHLRPAEIAILKAGVATHPHARVVDVEANARSRFPPTILGGDLEDRGL